MSIIYLHFRKFFFIKFHEPKNMQVFPLNLQSQMLVSDLFKKEERERVWISYDVKLYQVIQIVSLIFYEKLHQT